ncbi:MAG: response regulator [Beijerinckiaceae bacterium]
MAAKSFDGLRVFLVEDESLIAMLLVDMLADIGGTVVGVASRLDEAIEKASSLTFDVAILDVNLNGC